MPDAPSPELPAAADDRPAEARPPSAGEPGEATWQQIGAPLNHLSVEVVLAALVWLWLFSHTLETPLYWIDLILTGGAVWLAYVADRVFDVWRRPAISALSPRHAFYARHPRLIPAIWLLVLVCIFVLGVARLDARHWISGCALVALVCLYLFVFARRIEGAARLVVKKLTAGVVFALGSTFFVWSSHAVDQAMVLALVSFSGLCVANLAAISEWEALAVGPIRSAPARALGILMRVAVFTALITATVLPPRFGASVIIAVLVTALLHGLRVRIPLELRRDLADLVLVAVPPLVVAVAQTF